jgi:hypothetical protein
VEKVFNFIFPDKSPSKYSSQLEVILKKRILTQVQGGIDFQSAGILLYAEDLK